MLSRSVEAVNRRPAANSRLRGVSGLTCGVWRIFDAQRRVLYSGAIDKRLN